MKKILLALMLLFSVSLMAKISNEEFRSAWIITWEVFSQQDSTPAQTQNRIIRILDNMKKANMNAVILQVRQGGSTYFKSSYEPWGKYLNYKYPGFDPVAFAIKEAHKRGMEFHAWLNTFEARYQVEGAPSFEHPEWVCHDKFGNPMPVKRTLSPGLKEVRDYLTNVYMELVNNYDIDGIHLDYVRWSEYSIHDIYRDLKNSDEEDYVLPDFDQMASLRTIPNDEKYFFDAKHPYSAGVPEGFKTWEDWNRDSVTKFVNQLHTEIQKVKPHVRLSVAAIGQYNWGIWNGYHACFQDTAKWFNENMIDQLIGMHYHWTTAKGFYNMLTGKPGESWEEFVLPGVLAGRLYTVGPGSYVLDTEKVWDNHPAIIEKVRTIPWVDGFAFFSVESWNNHDYWNKAASVMFPRMTKVRAINERKKNDLESPILNSTVINSEKTEFTIQAANSNSTKRFILYRTLNSEPNPSEDLIVGIYFDREEVKVEKRHGDNKDKIYTYYSTMIDRFWNESSPSNQINL